MTPPPVNRHELFILGVENVLINQNERARAANLCATARDPEAAGKFLSGLIEASGLYIGRTTLREFFPVARKELELDTTFPVFEAAWNSHFTLNSEMQGVTGGLGARYRTVGLMNTEASGADYLRRNFPGDVPEKMYGSHLFGAQKPSIKLMQDVLAENRMDAGGAVLIDRDLRSVMAAMAIGMRGILFTDRRALECDLRSGGVTLELLAPDVAPRQTSNSRQAMAGLTQEAVTGGTLTGETAILPPARRPNILEFPRR